MTVTISPDRRAHWIRHNEQNRIPPRWVAFDSESHRAYYRDGEFQTHMLSAAIRWRHGLKTGDHAESRVFWSPKELWEWITEYCRPGQRTIVCAHNLGHDVRITQALTILPGLGWELEWTNLASDVSVMKWVSDAGTLVLCDLWTWLPVKLSAIPVHGDYHKLPMPAPNASPVSWQRYCLRDATIVYRAMSELIDYIDTHDMGNWQPTGSGMAYATWRHKYLDHHILVHADESALQAERNAMHTGRAEAWRHGRISGGPWTEIDMKNAYCRIGAECELPVKLKYRTGAITLEQYHVLCSRYRVLCHARVSTAVPCLPCRANGRTAWPVGTFSTTVWDTELSLAFAEGASVKVLECWIYTRAPVLQRWSEWVLRTLSVQCEDIPPVVRTWIKHCSRALIGRISLRTAKWEYFGDNPEGITGITRMTDIRTRETHRLMHIGDKTFMETDRVEGRDSCPQITGWIMAECRRRLWFAMRAAGLPNIAHVDTDSLLVSATGLRAMQRRPEYADRDRWAVKGSWRSLTVWGPRNWRGDKVRKVAGVPVKALELAPNVFQGERWQSIAGALADNSPGAVRVTSHTWHMKTPDHRRLDDPDRAGYTVPLTVDTPAQGRKRAS